MSTVLITPRSTRLAEDAILAAGVVPRIAMRMNDYRSVGMLVDAGVGCGLVPSLALGNEQGLVAVPLERRIPPRIVGIAWHRHRQQTDRSRASSMQHASKRVAAPPPSRSSFRVDRYRALAWRNAYAYATLAPVAVVVGLSSTATFLFPSSSSPGPVSHL